MNIQTGLTSLIALGAIAAFSLAPVSASAQSDSSRHRQDTKNTWRNVAIGSGVLGVLGLVEHNNTLAIAGLAGAAYSANRYEQDRKSQNKSKRARAALYSRREYTHNGHHYVRHTYKQHGQTYYKFVRG